MCTVTERNTNWFSSLSHMPVWHQVHKPLHLHAINAYLTTNRDSTSNNTPSYQSHQCLCTVHITFTSRNASTYNCCTPDVIRKPEHAYSAWHYTHVVYSV